MKFFFIYLFVFLLTTIGISLKTKAQPNLEKLPFKMNITELSFENQPDYFGGGEGNRFYSDFPYCPVKIDDEYWIIYKNGMSPVVYRWKGTNIENCKKQPDGFASFPVEKPYMLGGMWYDNKEKKLYAPLHCEVSEEAGSVQRQIGLAFSTDKGVTWHYKSLIVTRDSLDGHSLKPTEYSGISWRSGAGDFYIYVDDQNSYIYLYSTTYLLKKGGALPGYVRHYVARCAMKDMDNPKAWKKFYNGKWEEPGLGGKASYVNVRYVMYNTYLKKIYRDEC